MGEKWENYCGNRESGPWEVKGEYSRPLPESWRKRTETPPVEIVLEYRPPEPETVLTYSRPLPESLCGAGTADMGEGPGTLDGSGKRRGMEDRPGTLDGSGKRRGMEEPPGVLDGTGRRRGMEEPPGVLDGTGRRRGLEEPPGVLDGTGRRRGLEEPPGVLDGTGRRRGLEEPPGVLDGTGRRRGTEGSPKRRGGPEMREVTLQSRMELECWTAPPWDLPRSIPTIQRDLELDEDGDEEFLDDIFWKLNRKQPRKRRKGLWIFAACVTVLVVLTAAAGIWESRRDMDDADFSFRGREYDWHFDQEDLPDEITIPRWPTGQGTPLAVKREHGEELSAQEVYRRVNPSVVTVLTEIDSTRMSVGTGVVFTQDGYIVTNHHVVEGGRDCTVVLHTGYRCGARYVASDADQDLAVLKIVEDDLPEGLVGLAAAEFGDSDLLSVGDPVYAIGNPLGYELRGTLTDGIVSAINRDVEVDGRNMTLIQTNAALNSGNSGGPLINAYGQVVGINVIKMSSDYSTVEGLGFAIPSALMERMINDLMETGELQPEPMLGVRLLRLPTNLGGGVQGLEVQTVDPGSPAEQAGVLVGDYVLKADGETVSSSQEVLRIRRRFHLGDQLTLTLWREGEILEVTLKLDQAVEN